MFLCQLTGSVPHHPVVTPSGHLYEKSVLLNYLEKHDFHDPKTEAILDVGRDIIEINSNSILNKPSSSIALGDMTNILEILKDRISDMMIELQEIKRERDEARHQLTHLLYLRDSATQIIAKHLEEIDFLKNQLKESRQQSRIDKDGGVEQRDEGQTKIQRIAPPTNLAQKITQHAEASLLARKQRKIQARDPEAIKQYKISTIKLSDKIEKPTCFKNTIINDLPVGVGADFGE